jgi:CBS domain-containing protein
MKVSEIMTKNPATVTPDQTVQEAAAAMERADCGCLPVIEKGNSRKLIGIVTDRDIAMRAVGKGRGVDTRVQDVMSKAPCCCAADDDLELAETIMADEQVRRVPVVDASGCTIGMLSQADLARAAARRRDVTDEDVAHVVECVSAPN